MKYKEKIEGEKVVNWNNLDRILEKYRPFYLEFLKILKEKEGDRQIMFKRLKEKYSYLVLPSNYPDCIVFLKQIGVLPEYLNKIGYVFVYNLTDNGKKLVIDVINPLFGEYTKEVTKFLNFSEIFFQFKITDL